MQKQQIGSPGRGGIGRWAGWWSILVISLMALLLLIWLFPYGASAYHLEVGSRALQQTITAVVPSDSPLLTKAIAHLEAALHWQADNTQASRLLGQAFLLEGNLVQAAQAWARYTASQPRNPQGWWELAQIYKTMELHLEATPSDSLLARLPEGKVKTPVAPIDTPYCEGAAGASSCYVTLTEWQMPLAAGSQLEDLEPVGEAVRRNVLLMHPPSEVQWRLTVPATAPVLAFWMGIDPLAWELTEDGATFRVAVDGTEAFSHSLSVEGARQGWWPAQVDLQKWAGKEIDLTLETDTGPTKSGRGNWAGWGDVRLLSTDAASYVGLAPMERLEAAWHSAGFTGSNALEALDIAWKAGRYDEVLVWYKVAEAAGEPLPEPFQFRSAIAAIAIGLEPPHPPDPALLTIHAVADGVRIEGETLQWLQANPGFDLDYGDRLAKFSTHAPTTGVMWWSETAVAVVQVEQEADYQIVIRAQHSTPNPGQLQVGCDFSPLAVFTLTQTWHEFTTMARLSSGLHVIDIRYMQDEGDAILDWIELQRLSTPG